MNDDTAEVREVMLPVGPAVDWPSATPGNYTVRPDHTGTMTAREHNNIPALQAPARI